MADERLVDAALAPLDPVEAHTGEPPVPNPACTAWGVPTQAGTVADDLYEISAIAPSTLNPGLLWVLEDAQNAPALHALDTAGNTVATMFLVGVVNVDWEAIAIGACEEGSCIWVGDIGNNRQDREEVRLMRVPEPSLAETGGLARYVRPTIFPIAYAEGAVDAEALALTPDGRPVIVSKHYDWTADVYVVEELVPDVLATPVHIGAISTARDGETEMDGAVTAADIWPDGSRLLVRTYGRVWEYDLGEGGIYDAVTAPRVELPFAAWGNTEAVAYDAQARGYWQLEEWGHAPIWYVPCLD